VASERLYYDDAYTTRFTARPAALGGHGGRPAVELESTYFYPESGGQEADRGRLGAIAVLDVQTDGEGRIWHVTAEPLTDEPLEAEVDWARRFDAMQQHTGQHILSAAFERVLAAPTCSCRLGEERATLEVELDEVGWREVERVEQAANAVVWENRPVERHWVDEQGARAFPLRKPPPLERRGSGGRVRIVEIPDWDVSACGGTHTRRTGEVGAIKVLRWERVRKHLRFEFLCGGRALRDHAWRAEALIEAARRRTLGERELIAHLERAAAERDDLHKRCDELSARLLAAEARERVGVPARPVAVFEPSRSRGELRQLALRCLALGATYVALGAGAPEPVVLLGRARDRDLDLRELLEGLCARTGGKGGGSPDLVQTSATDAGAAEAGWRWGRDQLAGRLGPA
jgi:alanyl-tRNA synthetase